MTTAVLERHEIRPDAIYTLGEARALLRVARGTLYSTVKSGRLPVLRLGVGRGRTLRVRGEDLLRLMERDEV